MKNYLEFHCVHNGGLVSVDPDAVNEIRKVDDEKGSWTRLQVTGSPPVEIRESYAEVKQALTKVDRDTQ